MVWCKDRRASTDHSTTIHFSMVNKCTTTDEDDVVNVGHTLTSKLRRSKTNTLNKVLTLGLPHDMRTVNLVAHYRSVAGQGQTVGGAGASCHRGKLSLAIFGTTP